jgi:hypothetical protein
VEDHRIKFLPPIESGGHEEALHAPYAPYAPVAEEQVSDQVDATAADSHRAIGLGQVSLPNGDEAPAKIPFLVDTKDQPGTATRLMNSIGELKDIYVRAGSPVMLVLERRSGRMRVVELAVNSLVMLTHEHFQPYVKKLRRGGWEAEEVTLPERVARLSLSPSVVAELRPLAGITSTPLLAADGTIRAGQGYDNESGMFLDAIPEVNVPNRATRRLVEAALRRLRKRISFFPFANAERIAVADSAEGAVNPDLPAGADESGVLIAAATAICRQSLRLVPGVAIIAPYVSGAGAGKGLLARFIGEVAHGEAPRALTPGHSAEELDKRVSAELMTGSPMVFLDNVNATDLRSNVMASAITENPARVRRLGYSEMVDLNHFAFFCVTGNGLTLTEDLRRRFLQVRLEPGQERPEGRNFTGDFLEEVKRDRAEILSDFLTIILWGQQNPEEVPAGKPLGSFSEWARLCRDPFVALGCADPVEAMEQRSHLDPLRQEICEFFELWWRHHGESLVESGALHEAVRSFLNPYGRPRQYVARELARLDGTINNGLKFEALPKTGKWSPIKYKMTKIGPFIDDGGPVGDGDDNRSFVGLGEAAKPRPPSQAAQGPVRRARAISPAPVITTTETQPGNIEPAVEKKLEEI